MWERVGIFSCNNLDITMHLVNVNLAKPWCAWWCLTKSSMKMLRLLIDIGNTTTLAAIAIEGAAGFTTSSLYLAIFNLLAETASSLQVLDMLLVEINDEDMKVLFNLATHCHTLPICESMKIDQTLPFLKVTVRSHCPD